MYAMNFEEQAGRCRKTGLWTRLAVAAFACVTLASASDVFAQAGHGVSIFKECEGPKCVGEDTGCDISVAHADIFGDTTEIQEAWDTMSESNVRIPAVGNLQIVSVLGNTTCTVGGALPCTIGRALDGGLPGIVTFRSIHTITAADITCVGNVCTAPNQATVRVRDVCDSPTTTNCSPGTISTVQFTAATPVNLCNDNLNCTLDCCVAGVCSYPSACEGALECRGDDGVVRAIDPLTCEDGLSCTVDTCTAEEPTCCAQAPLCPPDAICCADGESCDDQNACTDDICVDDECCINIPVLCPPRECNIVECDPAVGCVYTPDCLTGADCSDGNACTDDVCTDGCCSNPPIVCDPRECNTVECDPASGCVYTPDCVTGADCNDNNACTNDVCTDGCCSNPPITCDPRECNTVECDPASGCTYTPDCTSDDDCEESPPNFCTTNTCSNDCCESTPVTCEPPPACYTQGECNPAKGCPLPVPVCNDPNYCPAGFRCDVNAPGCCVPDSQETCRTPGFWGTHACGSNGVNCEKKNSNNVTQAALNACGGCANVCGDIIDTTVLNDSDSALEAMCVSVQGASVRQLARQLTAGVLNCCISGGGPTCSGISIEPVFNACNAACAAGSTTAEVDGQMVDCIMAIDDFNNGRISDCHERDLGLCANGDICTASMECAVGSCGPHGPAGSSNACNSATGNACYVTGDTDCAGADDSNAPQSCDD